MTREHTPALIHALAQTKRLAYGQISSGGAIKAWDTWKGRYSYIREAYGSMVFSAWMLTCEYAQTISTWRAESPKRAANQADVCALLKAVLAMIEGDIVGPDANAQQALRGPSATVIDLKKRAAGDVE